MRKQFPDTSVLTKRLYLECPIGRRYDCLNKKLERVLCKKPLGRFQDTH